MVRVTERTKKLLTVMKWRRRYVAIFAILSVAVVLLTANGLQQRASTLTSASADSDEMSSFTGAASSGAVVGEVASGQGSSYVGEASGGEVEIGGDSGYAETPVTLGGEVVDLQGPDEGEGQDVLGGDEGPDEEREADEAEAEDAADEAEAKDAADELKAEELSAKAGEGKDATVRVDAPAEAKLPDGAKLRVVEVDPESKAYEAYREQALKALGTDDRVVLARFFDISIVKDGEDVQPEESVQVSIKLPDAPSGAMDAQASVVHFEGEKQNVAEPAGEGKPDAEDAIEADDSKPEDNDAIEADETGAVVDDDTQAEAVARQVPEVIRASEDGGTTSFDAQHFSVYGVVYTVDFHYDANGKEYAFSIPGGGFVSLEHLIEVLGVADTGADGESSSDVAKDGETIQADADEDAVEEASGDGAPTTFDEAISLNTVKVSKAAKEFVADIDSVEFSTPSLVWVGKVDKDNTVGGLKEAEQLEVQYSTELTEEQIEEIDAQSVNAGDWALISMQPFDSEETLIMTMKNGSQFVIKVTDAHEVAATSELETNYSYLISYHDANGYHVLKTDGTVETFNSTSDFDKLGSDYQWTFYYVFTEKDRETSLDYTYYFIRPINQKTHTIALNVAGENLVQYGTNNVALIPKDGGFVFLGYNHTSDTHIELGFEGGNFVSYNDLSENPTVFSIYQQDPLLRYSFTVKADEPSKGKVTGRDESGNNQNNVDQYIGISNDAKKNNNQIESVAVNHGDGQGNNKWIFDYWDMDGTRLEGVGATIQAGSIDIPSNGSVLTAHFKQNPAYIVPDNEKEGTTIESMAAWLNELKNRNLPLNDATCKKTAEVFDYENRIYRVDFTAQSSLKTFDGTIDLGFMLDVSGSMNFPSYLYNSSSVTGVKDLSQINYRRWNGDQTLGQREWGLDINHTYYIIADPEGTATVCYLYYYLNDWWLCDASKDKYNGNGRFDPANGHSADNTQYYGENYYKTTNYVIMEAGDRVTEADRARDGALLQKLGLAVGDPKTRAFYLEKSLNGTITELNEILSVLSVADEGGQNPDVKIAWNTFRNFLPNGTGQIQHNFQSVSSGINLDYDYNTYGGGTSTDAALLDAAGVNRNDINDRYSDTDRKNWDTNNDVDHNYVLNEESGFQWENSATKYAVLITDGAPQRGGKSVTRRYVTEAAQQLKNRGVGLVTVGLGIENVTSGKTLMYDIADNLNNEKMFYSAQTGDELEDVLLQIVRTIMVDAAVQGDVTDTIGQAFYPVDKMTGRPLTAGNMIDLEGNITTDSSKPHGIVTYDAAKAEFGVKWETQTFTWDGWHGTVYVKAKEDLLGGNAVKTNDGDAIFEAKTYKTGEDKPAVPLADKKYINDDPTQGEDPHYARFLYRESPRVNVNELTFTMNDTDWTVYLGTEVDPKEQLKRLWENIYVEEVIRKNHGVDIDGNNMPETGSASDDNTWYPVEIDSIGDDRESVGIGDKETFAMNDLIRALAEIPGKNYAWWNYSSHEPKWDVFLAQVLTTEGIVIDYDVYSLNGNDSSTIKITLDKAILPGEETDLINHSPHATTAVNTTDTDDEGQDVDVSAEKYTLAVVFSPDYSVVPVGQGGSGHLDFHTGTFGAIYQGHAAGTEESVNTHAVNVYAEPLDVQKKDNHDAAVEGAVFKLYRAAKEGESGEPLSSYDPSLTGSYYCISTATSGADGIAHLAPEPDDIQTPTHTIPVAGGQTAQNLLVPLAPGETYYLVEVSAPSGYKMDDTVKTVMVVTGPDLFTKLNKTDSVDDEDMSGVPARPTIAYNWNQGVAIIVKELGSREDDPNEATLVNHETRESVSLTDASGAPRAYMLRSDSDQSVVTQVVMVNDVVVDIRILKTDMEGNGLAGAIFQMRLVGEDGHSESDIEGVTGIGTITKTIDGEEQTFTSAFETTGSEQLFSGLQDGTYRLYEAYFPPGYISSFRYIQFTIENRLMKNVTTDSGDSEKVVPTPSSGNSLALLTIKNEPGAELPHTGGPGTSMIYLFGFTLIGLAGAGFAMKKGLREVE